jgi:hypothetical protein
MWENDMAHGKGTFYHKNGDIFEGKISINNFNKYFIFF